MHRACTSAGLVVLWTTLTELVVSLPLCTEGNKARDDLARSLIVKTARSGLGEACRKAHQRPTYAWGRTRAIHEVT
jgi:hypothetical protein